MAGQLTDRQGRKIRFIRRNGRVIPIRSDGPSRESRAAAMAGGAYGAVAGKKIASKGQQNVRGVVTMYHGTDKASGKLIRQSAIKARAGKQTFQGGVAQTGYAFASTDKGSTKSFSRMAQAKAKRGKAWDISNNLDAKERAKAALFGESGDVIKFEVSKKTFARKFIEDPENVALRAKGFNTRASKSASARYASKTNISRRRFIDGESLGQTARRHFKQARKTFRVDKKGFAKGAAQLGGGAALVAASLGAIYWGFTAGNSKKKASKTSP